MLCALVLVGRIIVCVSRVVCVSVWVVGFCVWVGVEVVVGVCVCVCVGMGLVPEAYGLEAGEVALGGC